MWRITNHQVAGMYIYNRVAASATVWLFEHYHYQQLQLIAQIHSLLTANWPLGSFRDQHVQSGKNRCHNAPSTICILLSHVHSEAEQRPANYSWIHPSARIKTKGNWPKSPSELSPVKTLCVEGKPHKGEHNTKIGISHNSATNSYLTPYLKRKSSDASLI